MLSLLAIYSLLHAAVSNPTASFECQLARQRIEDFIEDATSACCTAAGLHPGSKLDRVLVTDYRSADHRNAVSVLFKSSVQFWWYSE
jgi:hypothetical protein